MKFVVRAADRVVIEVGRTSVTALSYCGAATLAHLILSRVAGIDAALAWAGEFTQEFVLDLMEMERDGGEIEADAVMEWLRGKMRHAGCCG